MSLAFKQVHYARDFKNLLHISVDLEERHFDVQGRLRLRGFICAALTGACKPKPEEIAG